ncbi:MAG: hypothetical protein V3W20_14010, partial [Candidatus Neomarinimicrobiota bacterium]
NTVQQPTSNAKSYSISGKISYAGKKKGKIYVLAFQNRSELRNALNKHNVPNLNIFVAHDKIEHAGKYVIRGLKNKESYYIYAWMDTNNDRDVDFDRYEPTGWYQVDAGWKKVSINDKNSTGININLKEVTPYPKKDLSVKVGKNFGGTLKTIKGKKVLDVWGPPEARGYAQGYLVGSQIRDAVDYLLIEYFSGSASCYENRVRPWIKKHLVWTDSDRKELAGIIKGMKASKCNMKLPWVHRNVDVVDLMCINAFGETEYAPFCSAAAVWGPLTKNHELKDSVIMFRSQDGENDLRKATVVLALIMAQEPDNPSKNKWASVMFCPGFIGTYTGMNEFGVVMEGNYSAAKSKPIKNYGYTPISMFIRNVLLTANQINTKDAVMAVQNISSKRTKTGGPTFGGFNAMVAAPYYGQKVPVFVYEADSYGGLIRSPTEYVPTGLYTICTTNHYLKYEQKWLKTVKKKHNYSRYVRLSKALEKLEADNDLNGTTVTIKKFHKRICIVSNDITEQAFIFLPNARIMMVAYEDLKNKNSNAMSGKFSSYKISDLFH